MALKISTTPSELNLNIPTKNIENIEKLLHDSTYTELIEFSATFNTRLRIERKLRFPFLDPQTGVAQKHSNLFMKKTQRIPGLREGQMYTYPSLRWRKAKRQYLNNPNSYPWNYRPFGRFRDNELGDIPVGGEFIPPTEENSFRPSFIDEHSKDSHKDDGSKGSGWYYDDMDMHEIDNFDDPEEDSDDDFMEPRSGRKKRAGGAGGGGRAAGTSRRRNNEPDARRNNRGRGRKKPITNAMDNNSNSSDKFSEYSRRRSNLPPQVQTIHNPNPTSLDEAIPEHRIPTTERGKTHFSEEERSSISTQATTSGGSIMSSSSGFATKTPGDRNEKPRAAPSPYCDFCLGDTKENKKTMIPEELVSCSDCGRSGHPTCLQFTENMIISVKKYRWQCIECKCCSLCGTSENDETLLFCDSCDAGFHMYCLVPPLQNPPEGSWDCKSCIETFYKNK